MAQALYDGWDLAYRPNSPAALHLLTLLADHPKEVGAWVALPAPAFHPLPGGCEAEQVAVPDTPAGRLDWEQRRLGSMAKRLGVDLVHTFSAAALFGGSRRVYSPADHERTERAPGPGLKRRGLAGRLREALGEGGLARAAALFWPEDLAGTPPAQGGALRRVNLPPVVHPMFLTAAASQDGRALAGLDLPETFVLYQGSEREGSLQRLLAAWSWAAGAVGEYYPLLTIGFSPAGCERFEEIAIELGVQERARCLPALPLAQLAAVYRASSAVFHPEAATAWGGPLRQALACGKPLVGLEEPLSDAILGEAGYLVRQGGSEAERCRALGAALITVIVEEDLAQTLSHAALQRAESYRPERFGEALGRAYLGLLG